MAGFIGLNRIPPAQFLLFGYSFLFLLGWLLLSLDFFHTAYVSPLDNFFISASAVSTTGLVTVNVGEVYNFWGQLLILLLIQIGGLGYMTFSSFFLLTASKHLTKFHTTVTKTTFPLPKGFNIKTFIQGLVLFTFVVETVGAIGLYS